jgi:hypothetical protein
MAFLGDFGKIFLGGANTGTVVGAITGNPGLGVAAQRGADLLSRVPRQQQGQAVAVSQAPQTRPAETQSSGTSGRTTVNNFLGFSDEQGGGFEAVYDSGSTSRMGMQAQNVGVPAVIGGGLAAGRGLYSLLFGTAAGMAAPVIIDQLTGQPKTLRVTRKLQRDTKAAVMLLGIDVVADQLNVGTDIIVYILTKKMRNDGPYVTKAAVRKTRSTIGKMQRLCAMYDDLRPAARRRAPARRTGMTKITQVK